MTTERFGLWFQVTSWEGEGIHRIVEFLSSTELPGTFFQIRKGRGPVNTIKTPGHRVVPNNNCHIGGFTARKDRWVSNVRSLFRGFVVAAITFPVASYSQTLDDAVSDQLEIGSGVVIPCERLLDGDPSQSAALTGSLVNICGRGVSTPGIGPSTSSGGGATTPTSLPAVVQQRLREARRREKTSLEKKVPVTTGASADAVTELIGGLNLFVSAAYESLDRKVTTFEDGYDSDIWRVTVGADVQVTEHVSAGLAFDASHQDGEFDGGGDFDDESYGFIAFGSFIPVDDIFVYAYGGYASKSNDRNRIATFSQTSGGVPFSTSGSPNADYNADQYSAGLGASYNYSISRLIIIPRAGVHWARTDVETYSETGDSGLELTFHDDDETSLQSTLGMQVSLPLRTKFGMVEPRIGFDWIHEFDTDQREVQVSFVDDTRAQRFTYQTEEPDRDFFEIGAGASALWGQGIEPFVNYRGLVGHKFFDSHAIMFGVRLPL